MRRGRLARRRYGGAGRHAALLFVPMLVAVIMRVMGVTMIAVFVSGMIVATAAAARLACRGLGVRVRMV